MHSPLASLGYGHRGQPHSPQWQGLNTAAIAPHLSTLFVTWVLPYPCPPWLVPDLTTGVVGGGSEHKPAKPSFILLLGRAHSLGSWGLPNPIHHVGHLSTPPRGLRLSLNSQLLPSQLTTTYKHHPWAWRLSHPANCSHCQHHCTSLGTQRIILPLLLSLPIPHWLPKARELTHPLGPWLL